MYWLHEWKEIYGSIVIWKGPCVCAIIKRKVLRYGYPCFLSFHKVISLCDCYGDGSVGMVFIRGQIFCQWLCYYMLLLCALICLSSSHIRNEHMQTDYSDRPLYMGLFLKVPISGNADNSVTPGKTEISRMTGKTVCTTAFL